MKAKQVAEAQAVIMISGGNLDDNPVPSGES